MDGIAAIEQRMATIQRTLALLTPRTTSTTAPAASPAPVTGTTSAFAATLAAEVRSAGAVPAVAGFTTEQVANAAAVVEAGRGMGLSLRDQAIGVMTAIGESSLRVLDHGDTAGPDSRGLFQQRDNGAWGTLAERMDPTASAQSFFRALQRVDGRAAMAPTQVAHAVQRNADPDHYTRSWDDAVRLVARIAGVTEAQVAAG
ncbi:hypothetical protein [Actinotalea solisilvae]|uniref:hypothetical protein n=1 Tax=Actinotalea solisilvae TaxID=2072922 RepID=UPI0018F20650|nr:hypothetical protein [Actinotalea solisilvae]